jgi:hypothetical protein
MDGTGLAAVLLGLALIISAYQDRKKKDMPREHHH